MGKVTLQNIKNYLEGNLNIVLEQAGMFPDYIKEQIAYRMLQCKDDCLVQGKCKGCGCKAPDRLYSTQTCNKSRFPDLMNREDWTKFKETNDIQ